MYKDLLDQFTDLRPAPRHSGSTPDENREGALLVDLLNGMPGIAAEQATVRYLGRIQQTLELALRNPQPDQSRAERVCLAALLMERVALQGLLKLEELGGLRAITRLRRCAHCRRWFWARLTKQRYCRAQCRVVSYQNSPKGKKYRSELARANYQRKNLTSR